jgi:outer membrane receptor protein involved in Fe transport
MAAEETEQQETPENPAAVFELPTMEVIATTPLPSLGASLNKVPGNVQSLTEEAFENQNPTDLSEMLYRNIGSVNINQTQNNPFQNDVSYRGFQASPLLGSAIGVSVYMDGVRVNEGFGDTVNWDLIPQSALSSIDLIPGSNPLFGLNTLGGALALRTKSGSVFQGTEVEASGGSFGRWAVEAEHGGQKGNFDWYLTFNALNEDGWRDHSPSELRQLFGKVGWEDAATDIDLSYIFADNDLIGNGFAPESLLEQSREAVYTFPDETANQVHFINLRASHWFMDELLLAGNFYYRGYQRDTLNGDAELGCVDANDDPIDTHLGLCDAAGGEFEVEGEDRTTTTGTDTFGGTLQLSHQGEILGHGNSLTVGFNYDNSDTRFTQSEREGELFRRGLAWGILGEGAFDTSVDVATQQRNWAVFFTDTFDITEALGLTFSGRYQNTDVEIRDRTGDPTNADLNGEHTFNRFNPAVGLTYTFSEQLSLFGGWSESFRAPTPMELTCADPDDPCNLPNAFVADPPLKPVMGTTWEAGLRGKLPFGEENKLRWSLAYYRTGLEDDLLFTMTRTGSAGFFRNVDETLRQGVEVGFNGRWKAVDWFVNYGYVDATFQSNETLASVVEPDGVQVEKGDRVPGIPEHNLKFGADWNVIPDWWWVGGSVVYASDQFLRGDEGNNFDTVDDYTVLNLRTRVKLTEYAEVWGRIDNVTNADYATGGARNFNAFSDPVAEERFLAVGAPIAGWVGIKLRF